MVLTLTRKTPEFPMAIDFKTFNLFVDMVADARFPVMIRGRHGVGKSELVYQYAERKGKRVIERRVSQMTEGDLVGLPVVNGNRTSWNPPDWFKDACDEGVVLFLDEIDRGTTEVRQGCFQLTDSRACNGYKLHKDTEIFGAVNGGVHAAQYQVNDMDPAELDRWTVYDVEPTVEDWLDYAKNNVHPLIVDFIRSNAEHLEHKKDFEPGKVYPSRRSWKRLSDTVTRCSMLDGDGYKRNLDTWFSLAQGFVGLEAAIASKDYMKNKENMVSPDDILNGRFDGLKGYKLAQHTILVDKLIASGRLNDAMPEASLQNLMRYFLMLPSEAGMKFYLDCSKNPDVLNLVVKMHKLEVDGVKIQSHVQKLLGGSKKK